MIGVNVARINTDLYGVLTKWMAFTKPFHNLTLQEQETVAALLHEYILLKEDIKDESLLWKMVFDYDTKTKVKKLLGGVKDYSLQNVLSRLRTKGVIKDNKIIKSYIPNIDASTRKYKIIFDFNVKQEVKEEIA